MQIFDSGKIYNFMKIRHLMFAVSGIFIVVLNSVSIFRVGR